MAKSLEDFKKQWTLIKKQLEDADEEITDASNSRGMMDGVVEEGAKEVGRRVRELRQLGTQGTDIDDFKNDPEVKVMLKSMDEQMEGIEKNINRIKAQSTGPWAKTVTAYETLAKDITTEIAARKKQVSTKIGVGNKSLPDMEKLLKELNAEANTKKRLDEYHTKTLPKIEKYKKDMTRWLDEEVKKSSQDAWTRDQSEKFDRLMVDRNLNKNFGVARGLYQEIKEGVEEVKTAKTKNDPNSVAKGQSDVREKVIELEKIVSDYIAAEKDIGEAALKNAKNYDKIEKALSGMKQMMKFGEEALKQI